MHKNFKRFILIPVAISALAATNAFASERWFEIEVILMSHLGDKSKIKETYPDSIALPKYRRTFDLLSNYLSPDVSLLAQQLPQCGEREWPINKLVEILDPPTMYNEKSLLEINESVILEETLEQNTEFSSNNLNALNQVENNSDLSQLSSHEADSIVTTSEEAIGEIDTIEQALVPLTDEQHRLVINAETKFVYPTLNIEKKHYTNILCQMDQSPLNKGLAPEELALINDLTPAQMPRVINGAEFEDSKTPYLLSQESLQLTDIVTQVRRSRNFRPLLHLAWRQPVYSERRAIPVKLFAGDNLQQDYLKQKSLYLKEKKLADEQELALQSVLNGTKYLDDDLNNINTKNELSAQEGINSKSELDPGGVKASLVKKRINEIITNANQYPENIEELVSQVEILNNNYLDSLPLGSSETMAPLPPIQPWYLDGLFRVHLRNNFLNITAHFNVLNYDAKERASAALIPGNNVDLKTINFDQKRRVISTEVHYFDHPYMGMVVQIRRYKRPTPKPSSEN